MVNYFWLIPIYPLAAFAITLFFGRRLGKKSAWVSILGIFCSFLASCLALKEAVGGKGVIEQSISWFAIGGRSFDVGILIDPLCAMMLVVVTFVGFLIQIYSTAYMHGDKRYHLYFSYMSLFIFSMLGLVLSNNLIQIYIFWELVGLCSYFLISFWFEKPAAADAGKKAFITNRIGDAGLFLGIATLFYYLGTANFIQIGQLMGHQAASFDPVIITVAGLLIFCGAIGKSAQFPLHVWLPDAMEGPTPVSALIHAATMVAAGVYLVARCYAVFAASHISMMTIAYIGIITSFMAASIALVQNDIKRILAYSTISQLGYMMVALGTGGYTAGVFHLMTHAFFKALLFLCAGSVIHAIGCQDIRQMGGLFNKVKVTAIACFIGCLAIAGVPPLSGFWSKDEILLSAYMSGNKFLYAACLAVAFMTAFYMFRLLFLTFFGQARGKHHVHKPTWAINWPLIGLALFSVFAGFLGSPLTGNIISRFIYFHPGHHEGINYLVMASSIVVAFSGIFVAWLFYIKSPHIPVQLAKRFKPVYDLLLNKYWIDEIYDRFIIKPFFSLTKKAFSFDSRAIDGAVNVTAYFSIALSKIQGWIDKYIIDGAVNLTAIVVGAFGSGFRRFQTGYIQNYLLLLFTGAAVIIVLLRFI